MFVFKTNEIIKANTKKKTENRGFKKDLKTQKAN